ncbi:response regulator transcription factor [Pseudothauera rhizosphaerae]|nr:LuxR C-terminal-related transcriptional regulator [Pseudothauera rhizosphaerae]
MPASTISLARIDRFWDELSAFPINRTESALNHALGFLAGLVGAQQALWFDGVRLKHDGSDPVDGWRCTATQFLHSDPQLEKRRTQHTERVERGQVDVCITTLLAGAGRYRIATNREIVPPEWWESEFYRTMFAPLQIRDVLYLAHPIGEDIESWLGFWRMGPNAQPFGAADKERLDDAMRPLKWFHRRLALHYGLHIAENPLTATERKLIEHLLSHAGEADIGKALGLSGNTVHTYATRIYRKLGVKGRQGLAALWLGK